MSVRKGIQGLVAEALNEGVHDGSDYEPEDIDVRDIVVSWSDGTPLYAAEDTPSGPPSLEIDVSWDSDTGGSGWQKINPGAALELLLKNALGME